MTETLAITENARLEKLESTIERGLGNFVEVGTALLEIRDSRLYRETHESFETYCRERWGMSRQNAHELIGAAEVAVNLSGAPDSPALGSVAQARPLTQFEAEAQRAVFAAAQQKAEAAGKRLTAEHVQAAADEHTNKPAKPKRNGTAAAAQVGVQRPPEPEHAPAVPLEQALREPTSCVEDPVWQIDFNAEHATPQQLEEAISHLFQRLAARKKLLAVVRLYHELAEEERQQFNGLLEASRK